MTILGEQLIEIVRPEAVSTRNQQQELIRLGAFLFAGCRKLVEEDNSSATGFSIAPDRWSLGQALHQLTILNSKLDNSGLFGKFLSALLSIDESFSPSRSDPHPYHPAIAETFTNLATANDREGILRGIVYHWVNMPSALRLRRKADRSTVGAHYFRDSVTSHLNNITFFKPDRDLPMLHSIRHSLLPRRSQLDRSDRLLAGGDFRVALCPLIGSWYPVFEVPKGVRPRAFRALEDNSIANEPDLRHHLDLLIDAAIADDIRVLIFPELSIDHPQRSLLEKHLLERDSKLLAIFAGSFHTTHRPRPFNEAAVIDASGFVYWKHRKNSHYSVSFGEDVGKFFPKEKEAVLSAEMPEFINYGTTLSFLDTPIGRIVLLICTDAICEHELGYLPLIFKIRPELVIVLSMSEVTRDFRGFVERMARHAIGVIFVNAACVCASHRGVDLALVDLAFTQVRDSLPNRWRWPANGDAPEWYDYNKHIWTALTPAQEDLKNFGAWRLCGQGQVLGLVLDLATILGGILPDVQRKKR